MHYFPHVSKVFVSREERKGGRGKETIGKGGARSGNGSRNAKKDLVTNSRRVGWGNGTVETRGKNHVDKIPCESAGKQKKWEVVQPISSIMGAGSRVGECGTAHTGFVVKKSTYGCHVGGGKLNGTERW